MTDTTEKRQLSVTGNDIRDMDRPDNPRVAWILSRTEDDGTDTMTAVVAWINGGRSVVDIDMSTGHVIDGAWHIHGRGL